MRSVDRAAWLRRGLAGAVAALALAGCATTQQEAARLQLNSARIRASDVSTIVRAPGTAVQVTHLTMLTSGGHDTFVVTVHNPHGTAVADLPITVGVRLHHRRVYLNARSADELASYFDSHLSRIAAGGTLTWVYTADRSLPRGAHPFVLVGSQASPAVRAGRTAPLIRARITATPNATATPASLAVAVRNTTSVPQYQLQVYAIAERAGRVVAAGNVTVPHLGSNRTEAVTVPVDGRVTGARFDVVALPTIFQ